MDQVKKMQLKAKLSVARSQIGAARGLANMPTIPNTPVVGLNPIIGSLEEIVASIERLIDEL